MTVIRDAIDKLTQAEQVLAELGPLNDAYDKAEAEFTSITNSVESAKAQLKDASAGLNLAQMKNLRDYEEKVFAQNEQIKANDAKLADQDTQIATKKVEVNGLAAQHQQLEDSLASLRKQHFG